VQQARRKRLYLVMMGTCVLLVVLAWNVVRLWSTTAAVVMSAVAALIPPAAVIIGNLGAMEDAGRRDDDQTGYDGPA